MTTENKIEENHSSFDRIRKSPNIYWRYLSEYVHKHFNRLAVIARYKLSKDEFLNECFVKEYSSYKKSINRGLYGRFQDPNFEHFYNNFAEKYRNSILRSLGHYDDFNIASLAKRMKGELLLLCGEKGAGKTTLLLASEKSLMDDPKRKNIFIHISFAYQTLGFNPNFDPIKLTEEFRRKFIDGLDYKIREINEEGEINEDESNLVKFEREFRSMSIFVNNKDTPKLAEYKQLKRLEYLAMLGEKKYTTHYDIYKELSINYLQNVLHITPILVIDDIDRASKEVSEHIVNIGGKVSDEMGILVIISVREETVTMHSDIFGDRIKLHIMPPPFNEVVWKRFEAFTKDLALNKRAIKDKVIKDDLIIFVKVVIESINRPFIYANLIAMSDYDLDFLLELVRTLLESPFIDPIKVVQQYKSNNVLISWHIILNSLMLYIYQSHNEDNSFVINLFDNQNSRIEQHYANTLVRIRLLEYLRKKTPKLHSPISVQDLLVVMGRAGYQRSEVESALKAFAKVRLILTEKPRNIYNDEVSIIYARRPIHYYLSYLMTRYRYLQNVVPITTMDFKIHIPATFDTQELLGKNLSKMTKIIYQFIDFVKRCQEEERAKSGFDTSDLFEDLHKKLLVSIKEEETAMKSNRKSWVGRYS